VKAIVWIRYAERCCIVQSTWYKICWRRGWSITYGIEMGATIRRFVMVVKSLLFCDCYGSRK